MEAIAAYRAVSREDVTSIAVVSAELTAAHSPMLLVSYLTGELTNEEEGIYEKIFIKDNRIDCYQAIGIVDRVELMYGYIKERKDIGNIKGVLFDIYCPVHLMA